MKALILIVVLLATGAESQATWKQRRLTPEEEQRCYADARTAVLQIAELRLRIGQQENTQNSAASQIGQLKDDLAQQTQLTASLKEEVNQLKQQISRLQSASVGQIEVPRYFDDMEMSGCGRQVEGMSELFGVHVGEGFIRSRKIQNWCNNLHDIQYFEELSKSMKPGSWRLCCLFPFVLH
ncbi:hypothetical protein CAPTEDRAFT_196917, partial [Capitella teleta]